MTTEQDMSQEELAYKEAFDKALNDQELHKMSLDNNKDDVKDSSDKEKEQLIVDKLSNEEWDDKQISQTIQSVKEQFENESQPARRRGRPRKDDPKDDYEKIYSDYKQTAEAQIGLYKTRLQQLAQDYQELKAKQEEKPDEPEQLPEEVKEIFELYPDIGKAMSVYVTSQINKVKKSFKQDLEQQVTPIRSHLVLSDVQKHEMAIKSAHPDIQSILSSGDLDVWINSLPPVMKAGAQHVYQYGSTDDVISLLDEYKQQRGISNAPRSSRKQSRNQVRTASSQQNEGHSDRSSSDSQLLGMVPESGYGRDNSSSDVDGERGRWGYYGDSNSGSRDSGNWGGAGNYSDSENPEDDPLVQRVMAALAVKSNRTPVDINTASRSRMKTAEDIFKEMTADFEKDVLRRKRL